MKGLILALGFLVTLWVEPVDASLFEMTKIADGVYVHMGKHLDFEDHYDGDIANIGFVVGSDSVAIIDTGGSYRIGLLLREAVREVTNLPIRYVINTHIHPDHIFGNAAFLQDNPEIIGHIRLPKTLEVNQEAMLKALKKELGDASEGSQVILPTKTVSDTLDINLGGRVLSLKAWPKAHTNTDLTVMDDKSQTLWMGDLLFIDRTPSIDGDIKGWITAINDLKKLDAKIAIPGHGQPSSDKNAKLNRELNYLNVLLTEVREAIRNGVDLMQAIEMVGQSEQDNWLLFDIVNPRNINFIYPQLEWE